MVPRYLLVFFLSLLCGHVRAFHESFREKLTIRPIGNGLGFFHFEFLMQKNVSASKPLQHHYAMFPKSLAQIVDQRQVDSLQVYLTQGRYLYDEHTTPVNISFPKPSGAQVAASFDPSPISADVLWKQLMNSLSGLLCASLNFVDDKKTLYPENLRMNDRPSSNILFYAHLPREAACTENLTPWSKLLPCQKHAGLAALLRTQKLLDASYRSMGVEFYKQHHDQNMISWNAKLVLDVVLPLEDSHTLFSLLSLFEQSSVDACSVSQSSVVHIVDDRRRLQFDFPSHIKEINAAVQLTKIVTPSTDKLPFRVHKSLTGHGDYSGGFQIDVINESKQSVKAVYMDAIPPFLKIYFHTMTVHVVNLHNDPLDEILSSERVMESLKYTPSKDGLSLITFQLSLPASSRVSIHFDMKKAFLHERSFPFDAHRGFDLSPGVLEIKEPSQSFYHVYTEPLIMRLAVPDFSMPYNVITLAGSVLALAFGTFFNVLTRQYSLIPISESRGHRFALRIKSFLSRIKGLLPFERKKNVSTSITPE